jgi:hypothetical protein
MATKNPAAVALGRLGGQATSMAKTLAARENAKRPRARIKPDDAMSPLKPTPRARRRAR